MAGEGRPFSALLRKDVARGLRIALLFVLGCAALALVVLSATPQPAGRAVVGDDVTGSIPGDADILRAGLLAEEDDRLRLFVELTETPGATDRSYLIGFKTQPRADADLYQALASAEHRNGTWVFETGVARAADFDGVNGADYAGRYPPSEPATGTVDGARVIVNVPLTLLPEVRFRQPLFDFVAATLDADGVLVDSASEPFAQASVYRLQQAPTSTEDLAENARITLVVTMLLGGAYLLYLLDRLYALEVRRGTIRTLVLYPLTLNTLTAAKSLALVLLLIPGLAGPLVVLARPASLVVAPSDLMPLLASVYAGSLLGLVFLLVITLSLYHAALHHYRERALSLLPLGSAVFAASTLLTTTVLGRATAAFLDAFGPVLGLASENAERVLGGAEHLTVVSPLHAAGVATDVLLGLGTPGFDLVLVPVLALLLGALGVAYGALVPADVFLTRK